MNRLSRHTVVVALLLSATGAPIGTTAQAPGADQLATGVVIPQVVSASDPAQSYALYLPSGYVPQKKWPIIYAFDPGAQGQSPVEQMKALAEG